MARVSKASIVMYTRIELLSFQMGKRVKQVWHAVGTSTALGKQIREVGLIVCLVVSTLLILILLRLGLGSRQGSTGSE